LPVRRSSASTLAALMFLCCSPSVARGQEATSETLGSKAIAGLFASDTLTASSLNTTEQQPSPEPKHTGVSALLRSTGSDFAAFPRRRSTWVILGIGAGAAALARPFDEDMNEKLVTADGLRKALKPGKYLGYAWVQGGTAIGLYLVGRYAMEPEEGTHTNKVSHLGFDLLRANLVTQAFTYAIKSSVRRDRPTGECCAFPSGHASVTFATASVLERHFGYRASWPMFLIAGYVSASRLTDNRHFPSDVLFGSALGMAVGWTVVGRHGHDNFALLPAPVHGGVALTGSWDFGHRGQSAHDNRASFGTHTGSDD